MEVTTEKLRLECLKIASAEARSGVWIELSLPATTEQRASMAEFVFDRAGQLFDWLTTMAAQGAAATDQPEGDYERLGSSVEGV